MKLNSYSSFWASYSSRSRWNGFLSPSEEEHPRMTCDSYYAFYLTWIYLWAISEPSTRTIYFSKSKDSHFPSIRWSVILMLRVCCLLLYLVLCTSWVRSLSSSIAEYASKRISCLSPFDCFESQFLSNCRLGATLPFSNFDTMFGFWCMKQASYSLTTLLLVSFSRYLLRKPGFSHSLFHWAFSWKVACFCILPLSI